MTTTAPRQYRLISADGHYNEPGDLWTSRVSAKVRDAVPRIESLDEGDAWVMATAPRPMAFGWGSCAGRRPEDLGRWCRFEDINAGSYDPKARIGEMDLDGVDAEVISPRHLAVDLGRRRRAVHPRWCGHTTTRFRVASYAPDRLAGVAIIPHRGVDDAVKEIDRILTLPGISAFLLRCYPNGTLDIEPEDDAVWARIAESGKPLTIHVSLANEMPRELKATALPGTVHFYDAPNRMLQFIFSGVLDRFPSLTIVLTEVDCGWLPYFADRPTTTTSAIPMPRCATRSWPCCRASTCRSISRQHLSPTRTPSTTVIGWACNACCGPTTIRTSSPIGPTRGRRSTPRSPACPTTNATPSSPATRSASIGSVNHEQGNGGSRTTVDAGHRTGRVDRLAPDLGP